MSEFEEVEPLKFYNGNFAAEITDDMVALTTFALNEKSRRYRLGKEQASALRDWLTKALEKRHEADLPERHMSEWIDCSEKLPNYESRVLMGWRFDPNMAVRIGKRVSTTKDGENWFDESTGERMTKSPSHWRALPERP